MILVADCGGSKYEIGLFASDGKLLESKKNILQLDLVSDYGFFSDISDLSNNLKPSVLTIGIAGISRLSDDYLKTLKKKLIEKTKSEQIFIMSDVELLRWQLNENALGISIGTGSALIYINESGSQTWGGYGYLFNDYLSGWWWFQRMFEASMLHLEDRGNHLGFEQDFLHLISLKPDRRALIKYAYEMPRHVLAAHASKILLDISGNSWVTETAETAAQHLLSNIERFSITSVSLQGGMITNHKFIRESILSVVRKKSINCDIVTVDNLLLGGYRHWLKNQSF